ncbi:two-component sensor histidine kinase [Microbispora cellulosiformans]|uniref:Two-component sensor histidine kinase n=1 Tax=Microbispora cellulosiformans TaxID=2614688 RepID=A0A5J5KA15_9ACTN|nr:histidine kinase [Microbispora cellulosiformans]KAA9381532.1 two-component sensor histidine kinase [Microbispora cellulosiformans]
MGDQDDQGVWGRSAWPVWTPARPASRAAHIRGVVVLSLLLVWPLREALGPDRVWPETLVVRVALGAVTLLYAAGWLGAMVAGVRLPPRRRILLIGTLFALAVVAALLRDGPSYLGHAGVFGFALAVAAWLLPARWSVLLGVTTWALQVLTLGVAPGPVVWEHVGGLVPGIVIPVAVTLLIRLVVQLGQAREEIAALAAAAERDRLARDLHDVLGHSLTTITVKSGLARRVLESGGDPELALAELRDVERLSRQAHGEVRLTVSGRRRPSLAAELAGARAALRAAGIGAVLPPSADHVRADLAGPFAYVLREGVTNVIRHSGANRCEVLLGDDWLEVRDDGPGQHVEGPGNGLSGLAERLRAVGGRIEAGPLPGGGFRLRASRA